MAGWWPGDYLGPLENEVQFPSLLQISSVILGKAYIARYKKREMLWTDANSNHFTY